MKKLKPLEHGIWGCLQCPANATVAPMSTKIIAGFGGATITKNDEHIYSAPGNLEWRNAYTLMKFEIMARKEPNADWRFHLDLPLRSATYQRQGKNAWVLVEQGQGFA